MVTKKSTAWNRLIGFINEDDLDEGSDVRLWDVPLSIIKSLSLEDKLNSPQTLDIDYVILTTFKDGLTFGGTLSSNEFFVDEITFPLGDKYKMAIKEVKDGYLIKCSKNKWFGLSKYEMINVIVQYSYYKRSYLETCDEEGIFKIGKGLGFWYIDQKTWSMFIVKQCKFVDTRNEGYGIKVESGQRGEFWKRLYYFITNPFTYIFMGRWRI